MTEVEVDLEKDITHVILEEMTAAVKDPYQVQDQDLDLVLELVQIETGLGVTNSENMTILPMTVLTQKKGKWTNCMI